MKVLNNEGEIEDFQPIRIKNKLLEETDLSEEEAERIRQGERGGHREADTRRQGRLEAAGQP